MIIVPGKYTPRQIKRADAKASEFKPSRATSASARLDDVVATGGALILCPPHSRKFNARAARYRPHPEPKFRKCIGRCDVCQELGLSLLYLPEAQVEEERRKVESFKRGEEYRKILKG